MIATISYPLIKKQLIESQTPNGKCYLRLLCVLPSFNSIDANQLEDVIINMTTTLGSNPKGIDVMYALRDAEEFLKADSDSGIGFNVTPQRVDGARVDVISGEFIESVMRAPYRFGFEDRGGVMHVTYYLFDKEIQDSSTEIETEMGFASRYILQMMCNQGRHIGATIEDIFDQFLEDDDEDGQEITEEYFRNSSHPPVPITPSFPVEHNTLTGLYDKDPEKRETQSKVEDIYNRIESQRSKQQTSTSNEDSEMMKRLLRMEEKINSVLSMREENSLRPDDSSSNIGRYTKNYMKEGTVTNENQIYNHTRGGTMLAIKEEGLPLDVTKDVAIGYIKTKDIREKEVKQLKKIAPINGLANPFKSQRLNMLAHFHTAIQNVSPNVQDPSYLRMMSYMVKYMPKCASEEFAYQLIVRTFDMKELVVLSNPFKLPFIEVGMQITDSTLVKCFTLLKNEYKTLWFNEMKHLHVPSFHSEFSQFSNNEYSNETRKSNDQSHNSRKHKEKGSFVRSRTGRSTLSILN